MIAWWWAVIAWVIGELMGFGTIIICMGSGDKAEEKKKAADAGTSTADRETVRKDFFL